MTAVLAAMKELRAIDQWVAWHWKTVKDKDGNDVRTKPPFVASNGSLASVSDPATWMAYAEAVKAYKKAGHVGLGFMVTPTDPYCGIDLDHCRDKETGVIDAWADGVVKRLHSYTEITPSGEGLRVLIKGRLTVDKHTKSMADELGAHPKAKVEIYDQKRYFTVTGNHLSGTPTTINEHGDALAALCEELWPPQQVSAPTAQVTAGPSLTAQQVIQLLKAAKNSATFEKLWDGDMSEYNNDHSRADAALLCLIAFYSRDPEVIDQVFRQSKLAERGKWPDRADYRKLTIDKALAKVTETYRARVLAPTLPAEFWNARAELRLIRQAAYSRELSADAVLGAVLARISAGAPHQLRIPAIVTADAYLSLLVNLIGGRARARAGPMTLLGKSSPLPTRLTTQGTLK